MTEPHIKLGITVVLPENTKRKVKADSVVRLPDRCQEDAGFPVRLVDAINEFVETYVKEYQPLEQSKLKEFSGENQDGKQ